MFKEEIISKNSNFYFTYHIKEKKKIGSSLSRKKDISSGVFFSEQSSLSLKSEKKTSTRWKKPTKIKIMFI